MIELDDWKDHDKGSQIISCYLSDISLSPGDDEYYAVVKIFTSERGYRLRTSTKKLLATPNLVGFFSAQERQLLQWAKCYKEETSKALI